MAEYLDNDEDGQIDDADVLQSMLNVDATLVMFRAPGDLESSGLFDRDWIHDVWGQDLYAQETQPTGRFDTALEEVLHLVNTAGHVNTYPAAFDPSPGSGSILTEAMDVARGGPFESIADPYPSEAWYHYDDHTCEYECMAIEYLYWAVTTALDAQSSPSRCDEIANEWEPCTPESFEATDVAMFSLVISESYGLPSVIPDGAYHPSAR